MNIIIIALCLITILLTISVLVIFVKLIRLTITISILITTINVLRQRLYFLGVDKNTSSKDILRKKYKNYMHEEYSIVRNISLSKLHKFYKYIDVILDNLYPNSKKSNEIAAKDHLKTYVPTGNKQGRPRELPNYDFSGIYQLKNTVNGKIYIGQAQNILQRFNEHRRNRNGHLIYRDCYLYRDIKKYGWQKFEISVLERVDDVLLLNEREIFWINELNPKYNMKDGGDCARGWHHTEETKRKMSETKSKQYLGENNPFYGKTHSEKTKKKMAKAAKNRRHSEETKLKMRAWYKPELFYKRVGKFDKETNELLCEYKSVNDAAKDNGVFQSNMSSHLGGRNKTCKGYIFKFI